MGHLRSKQTIFRVSVMAIVLVTIFLKQIHSWYAIVNRVDMLYVGEKIASARTFFLENPFWKNIGSMFYLHGFFLETGEAVLAFKLFGTSIGSYLLFDALLILVSYGLFILLLHRTIRNNWLFVAATILFTGLNVRYRIVNNVITIIYLLLLCCILRKRTPHFPDLLKLSLLVLLNFAYTVEFAYYLAGLHLVITGAVLWKRYKSQALHVTRKQIFIAVLIAAPCLAWGILMGEQVRRMLFVIPTLPLYVFKPHLPPLNHSTFVPYYTPLVLAFVNGVMLYFVYRHEKKSLPFILSVYFLGLLNFYGIYIRADMRLIRIDTLNIAYFIFYQFLVTTLILDRLLETNGKKDTAFALAMVALIISTPFLDKKHLKPFYDVPALMKFAINLPLVPDTAWMRPEANRVAAYIRNNSSPTDSIYVFDNESLYYYLTDRQNATDFYVASVAEPQTLQEETIRALDANPPKYIVYSSDYWTNAMESLPQPLRLKKVNGYLLQNFPRKTIIGKTILLSK